MTGRFVSCVRPAQEPSTDDWGNSVGESRPRVEFLALLAPPTTATGSQIVDGVLRQMTVTKPTLYAEGRPDVVSGDPIELDGEAGWQVDGDPADWGTRRDGSLWPLVIELRRTVG